MKDCQPKAIPPKGDYLNEQTVRDWLPCWKQVFGFIVKGKK
jgi:hypothetical protein